MTPRPEDHAENETLDCQLPSKGAIESKFRYEMSRLAMPSRDESRLLVSYSQLSKECSSLLGKVPGRSEEECSPTLDACRNALRTDMMHMLDEANVLMQNMDDATQLRASLAQARVNAYRETIQAALESRFQLDNELALVANSISTQIGNKDNGTDELYFRVSSWRTPSLCFDLGVSEEVHFERREYMPIKLSIRAIAEIHLKDINASSVPKYSAFRIHVEKCKHDNDSMFPTAGKAGEALVKLCIHRIGETETKQQTWGGEDADAGFVRVIEARVVQKNAYPPLPKRSVDLYTSSYHGSSDTAVMLRFNTHHGQENGCVPEVYIEVVMASS